MTGVDRRLLLDGTAAPVVPRAAWEAAAPVEWPVERSTLRGVVVHHTATANDEVDPLAMVRRVQHFHSETRGWGDIGYSLLVLPDGRVVEGREGTLASVAGEIAQGGHALGHNPGTLGVALAGRFHDRLPTDAAWASLVDVLATVMGDAGLDPLGGEVALANGRLLPATICGHRHTCDTACPGDAASAALDDLRYAVAAAVGERQRLTSTASGPDAAQNAG